MTASPIQAYTVISKINSWIFVKVKYEINISTAMLAHSHVNLSCTVTVKFSYSTIFLLFGMNGVGCKVEKKTWTYLYFEVSFMWRRFFVMLFYMMIISSPVWKFVVIFLGYMLIPATTKSLISIMWLTLRSTEFVYGH